MELSELKLEHGCPHKHEVLGPRHDADLVEKEMPDLSGRRTLNSWQNMTPAHIAVYFGDDSYTIIERDEWDRLCEEHIVLTKQDFPFSIRKDRSCVGYYSTITERGGSYAGEKLGTTDALVLYVDGNSLHNCMQNLRKMVRPPALGCRHIHLPSSEWTRDDAIKTFSHVYRFMEPSHVEVQMPNVSPIMMHRADWTVLKQRDAYLSVKEYPSSPGREGITIMCTLNNPTVPIQKLSSFVNQPLSGYKNLVIDGDDFHLCLENLHMVHEDHGKILRPSRQSSTGFYGIYLKSEQKIPTFWLFHLPGLRTAQRSKEIPIPRGVEPLPIPAWVQVAYVEFAQLADAQASFAMQRSLCPDPPDPFEESQILITEPKSSKTDSRRRETNTVGRGHQAAADANHLTGIIGITIRYPKLRKPVGPLVDQKPSHWMIKCGGDDQAKKTRRSPKDMLMREKKRYYERIPDGEEPFPIPQEVINLNNNLRRAVRQGLPANTYL
jgi:hypothetical protein